MARFNPLTESSSQPPFDRVQYDEWCSKYFPPNKDATTICFGEMFHKREIFSIAAVNNKTSILKILLINKSTNYTST